MKLYATVTSERATKGQGGEYLDIEIHNEHKEIVAILKVRNVEGERGYDTLRTIAVWHNGLTDVKSYADYEMTTSEPTHTKGKKQKGENSIGDLDREAETRREIDLMS